MPYRRPLSFYLRRSAERQPGTYTIRIAYRMYMLPLFRTSTHVWTWVGEHRLRKNAWHPMPLFVLGRRCYHLISTIVALYKRACASVPAFAEDLDFFLFFPFSKIFCYCFSLPKLSGIARELQRSRCLFSWSG